MGSDAAGEFTKEAWPKLIEMALSQNPGITRDQADTLVKEFVQTDEWKKQVEGSIRSLQKSINEQNKRMRR